MKLSFEGLRRSIGAKVAVIGLLVLILLIPTAMIRDLTLDRSDIEDEARRDIFNAWGGEQLVAGPVLALPYKSDERGDNGAPLVVDRVLYVLPDTSSVVAVADTELRYRGIHKVPVYSADIEIATTFSLMHLQRLGVDFADIGWSQASVLAGLSDPASLAETPMLQVSGSGVPFQDSAIHAAGLPLQLAAEFAIDPASTDETRTISVSMNLRLKGSASLSFLLLAGAADVKAVSDWAAPSFFGRILPASRLISDSGFEAEWHLTGLGRSLPPAWMSGRVKTESPAERAFGVRFVQPVGLYQLMFRALNYAIMFIGLTFVAWFMMEVSASLRLHPLQYLLVGFANSVFYLLLLSLAEHVGFGLAFAISASASAGLIVAYSRSVLRSRHQVLAMAAVLSGLYVFLYLTLRAETYALLSGAIGLWAVLATTMYLTRNVDWYRPPQPIERG